MIKLQDKVINLSSVLCVDFYDEDSLDISIELETGHIIEVTCVDRDELDTFISDLKSSNEAKFYEIDNRYLINLDNVSYLEIYEITEEDENSSFECHIVWKHDEDLFLVELENIKDVTEADEILKDIASYGI